MMQNLKIRQEQTNQRIGNFGSKKLSSYVIDKMIDEEEARINKRRVLCNICHTQKSTSGSCFC